jgi:gamma-glutamyltranspeptidase / glutathione hydrolase / leukotriene-C4 hydrolase
MLIHMSKTNKQDFVDFREEAPGASTADMFVGKPSNSTKGGLSIAVPGEIKGYHEAWKLYGNVTWKSLFEEPIKLAREGLSLKIFKKKDFHAVGCLIFV